MEFICNVDPTMVTMDPEEFSAKFTEAEIALFGHSSRNRASSIRPPTLVVDVTLMKGSHGIGLDLGAAADTSAIIRRFKELPPDVPNPALSCSPEILVGDVIVAVNGVECPSLMDAVNAIRSSGEAVTLSLRRYEQSTHSENTDT
jgi:hypothetical protein